MTRLVVITSVLGEGDANRAVIVAVCSAVWADSLPHLVSTGLREISEVGKAGHIVGLGPGQAKYVLERSTNVSNRDSLAELDEVDAAVKLVLQHRHGAAGQLLVVDGSSVVWHAVREHHDNLVNLVFHVARAHGVTS